MHICVLSSNDNGLALADLYTTIVIIRKLDKPQLYKSIDFSKYNHALKRNI